MLLLLLTLLFVIGAGAGSSDDIYIYHRAGDEVIMSCNIVDSSETSCSIINWLYNRDTSGTHTIVRDGQINKVSPQADKLSLDHRCSLTITNISSEDAGRYICRYGNTYEHDTNVYLNILTLSADQSTDPVGGVTLTCTLWRHTYISCEEHSLRWLDEERDELKKDDDEVHYSGQMNCVSHLTITHQSNHSRRYTCQFVKSNEVKISANYTLVSTVDLTSDSTSNKMIIIIIGASVGLLTILVIVGLTVFITSRRKTGAAEEGVCVCVCVRVRVRVRV
uniref:Ig-like domain-containing protein n=1 Tax=Gouania willdenowi TaxID=441366 RepID=A0A8C5DUC6_GOUWI